MREMFKSKPKVWGKESEDNKIPITCTGAVGGFPLRVCTQNLTHLWSKKAGLHRALAAELGNIILWC